MAMSAYIPIDVMMNHIFNRLPTKSVVRCGCVCKEWLEILSGSEFRKIHIRHQTTDNRHHRKFLCGPVYRHGVSIGNCISLEESGKHNVLSFYSLDLESSSSPKLTCLPGIRIHKNIRPVNTLGYSNSMLCMEVRCSEESYVPRWDSPAPGRDYIVFLNPSTSYRHVLPDKLVPGPHIVGFGYDSCAADYKFVRVDIVTRHPHVYSLKSNSWRINVQSSDQHKIQLDASWDCFRSVGTFLEGSIYWVTNRAKAIVGFNLKDENFTELQLPSGLDNGDKSLKVLEGSLCMINKVYQFGQICVEMWWLKDENKWSKLMKLTSETYIQIYPLAFTDNGNVVCCVDFRLEYQPNGLPPKTRYALVDPRTNRIEDFHIPGTPDRFFWDHNFQSHFPGYID